MNDKIKVTVYLDFPDRTNVGYIFQLDAYEFHSLVPLDRDWDVPFDITAQIRGKMQLKSRAKLCKLVEDMVQGKILELINERDPKNGYTPEENKEWEALKNPKS